MDDITKPTKIAHIAVAVKELNEAVKFYQMLGADISHREVVEDQGVNLAIIQFGESRLELLEPLNESTPVGRFIAMRGEGMHHIAIEVNDIEEAIRNCKRDGYKLIDTSPRRGAENKLVAFVHPTSACGVLIELVQSTEIVKGQES
ncbi:methylmalonyl-CoA epimerase [Calditrichota bacterium]